MDRLWGKTGRRRGVRIARRLPVMLHWREPQGAWREIPAQTKILSRHGCLLDCSARIKLTDEVMVWWLEKGRYSQARAVFRTISDDSVEIALEFLDTDDFWGMDFTGGAAPPPRDADAITLRLYPTV